MSQLAPSFHQQAPLEHDVFADREDPVFKHRAQLLLEPVVQRSPLLHVGYQLDAKADFGKRNGTDEEAFKRLRTDESHYLGLRAGAPQFRQDVGVEQVAFHSDTSRTGA